ncbi:MULTISPECIES: DksA/TraR family C4-type zinc finger protein [Tatumella]|uniref:DksA/TraR family C4-type zinc finger protein n=1 Tax=Tatumella punctata TaxID=399969 RepID=A0ABW1VM66_9GAMM|nr:MULTISPECIES: DksA/TraR family C4-type zinc finger protein [unclassified Tatumella]MBS0856460.1 DksA/TraR family C4-type zinc finger protein [Tatumella sp. JGM16]MBS0876198.1 DksA/TraR family C4-type zinc finger protein [Tatumella sp. JGM82]MBS0889247.1 DksA/TraR family C4-type zinc finger protein [Tatumella sp. JGM94]MBS0893591.1 DksA/TraR family C4-type zinc finger protein [Tatumella sp. JGM130]MBS0902339.1 DksA/TraR family C4-type zinc finger protein [Tatumella sp. JGM100]
MAGGWSDDGAVNKQIDATVEDAVARARDHLGHGESAWFCEQCGEPIPDARRKALAGVRYCVSCQSKMDKQDEIHSGYNRRGSKDSQLR